MEYKEKHNVKYSCGCSHELGLQMSKLGQPTGAWQATGNNQDCEKHRG